MFLLLDLIRLARAALQLMICALALGCIGFLTTWAVFLEQTVFGFNQFWSPFALTLVASYLFLAAMKKIWL